eukprot:11217290-Heterocapsa_arctica.AAC.1
MFIAGSGCRERHVRKQRECTQPTTSRSNSTTRVGLSGSDPPAADAPKDQRTWEGTVQGSLHKADADTGG